MIKFKDYDMRAILNHAIILTLVIAAIGFLLYLCFQVSPWFGGLMTALISAVVGLIVYAGIKIVKP